MLGEGAGAWAASHFPADLRDHYEPLELLGQGGMGWVLRCRDLRLGREVALKLARGGRDPQAAERFLREGEALARVRHPGVVEVYDAGASPSGELYLVMELLQGAPLNKGLGGGALEPMLQVAEALDAVHEAGLIHRDVKPANIVATRDNRIVLVDFGLTQVEDWTRLTRTGQVSGTPAYLAPELLEGEVPGAPADWYAWGVSLYELAEGELPFEADEVLAMARSGVPVGPRQEPGDPKVARLVDAALTPDPSRRLDGAARARELMRATTKKRPRPASSGSRSAAVAVHELSGVSTTKPAAPASRARPLALGGLGLLLLLGLGFAWLGPRAPASAPASPGIPASSPPARRLEAETARLEEVAREVGGRIPDPGTALRIVPWCRSERLGRVVLPDEQFPALQRDWRRLADALLAWCQRLAEVEGEVGAEVWALPEVRRVLEEVVYGVALRLVEEAAVMHMLRVGDVHDLGKLAQVDLMTRIRRAQDEYWATLEDLDANLRVLWEGAPPLALRGFLLTLRALGVPDAELSLESFGGSPVELRGEDAGRLTRAQLLALSWSPLRRGLAGGAGAAWLAEKVEELLASPGAFPPAQEAALLGRSLVEELRMGRRKVLRGPLRASALLDRLESLAPRAPEVARALGPWLEAVYRDETNVFYGPPREPASFGPIVTRARALAS